MLSFLIRCCVYASAGLLAGCALPLERNADWNAITKYGFRQITPLPMPEPETGNVPAVTIPNFTFEGYEATIAEAWTPDAGSQRGWGLAYFITELVPRLGAVLVPVRYADGRSDEFVGVRQRRQAAKFFRGSFENFA